MTKTIFYIFVIVLYTFTSCNDIAITATMEDEQLADENIVVGRMACYTSMLTSGSNNTAEFSSDAEWLTFVECEDGNDSIYIEENGEMEDRVAKIVSKDKKTGKCIQFKFRQLGRESDSTSINTPSVYNRTFGAGWGYDGNSYFGNAKGVKEQILNPIKIQILANKYIGEHLVSDVSVSETNSKTYAGETSQELSSAFGAQVGIGVSIPIAFSMDINARFQKSDMQSGSRTFAVNHFVHVIKRRSVGIQNIVALKEQSQDCFTYGFKQALKKLAVEDYSEESLKEFIGRFGNCVVSTADIGGCMDYNLCIEKNRATTTSEVEISANVGLLSLFSVSVSNTNKDIYTRVSENSSYTVTARGGDVSKLGVALLQGSGSVSSQESLTQWISSICDENSEMVGCQLVPIWEILPDGNTSEALKRYVTKQQVKDNEYALPSPTSLKAKFAMPMFKTSEETLIKIGYAAGQPCVEFCEEYIPSLNVLGRVRVAYPVKNGKPDYHRGIFPGDGGHHPGYIYTKTDGSRVYEAFSDRKPTDILDSIYYADFELFDKPVNENSYVIGSISDYYLETNSNESKEIGHRYPVVKVGQNVWMRKDLSESNYLSICSTPIRYVVLQDKTNNRNYYKTSLFFNNVDVIQALLPAGYVLPSYNDVDTLLTMTIGKIPYLMEGGVSGLELINGYYLDYQSNIYETDNFALIVDDLNGKVESIMCSYTGLSVLGYDNTAVPIRAIRSEKFEYH